ncbi:hypothetical protein [Marispirochaeta aestuarii]|uniref:hypothetical protein n=1 Tax=Marispirochaeta aestuarii TaxID=1963862 RepID=UPI002ABE2343|nr:hypothetical protein [Marispirochaeta aestuarii]
MRFIGIFLLFSCVVFTASAEDDQLDLILSNIRGESGVLRPLDLEILAAMLEYADKQGKTIFELLNESFHYLQERGLRIRLDGNDLRHLNRRFELGGRRVNTLLPVEKIGHIEIGSVLQENQAAMEVFLFEKHSDFLELGDFYLSEHFGFTSLEEGWYRGGFGVKVRYLFMSLELEELNLYEERKIAIWVQGIPRPKRWRIDPIRERRDFSE